MPVDKAELSKVHFETSCPFLLCLETTAHDHPVCPHCGAVRFGNIMCPTCENVRESFINPILVNGEIQEGKCQSMNPKP